MIAVFSHPAATRRIGSAVGVLVLAAGVLAGCGGSDGAGEGDEATPDASESATASESADVPVGYLPVPGGATLTLPGAALAFGDTATIAWRPQQDTVVALDLTIDRIDQTSYEESFEGWVVTKEMKSQVPYFVRGSATNVGDVEVGTLLVPLYAMAGATDMYEPLDFREEVFEPCPGGNLPEVLRPGKSAELCFVYLLPEAQSLTAVAFDPVGELEPITWTGEVTEIEKPKDKKRKKDKDKKREKDGGGSGDEPTG